MTGTDVNAQRIAMLQQVRSLHNNKRIAGFVLSLLGAMAVIWGRSRADAPDLAVPAGIVLIAAGWALFAYVIFARIKYIRANPLER